MSNVLVEKNKLDILANAISNKSGEPLTLTLDEMVEAVDGIKTEVNLQEKQYSVNKAGQELIQADSGYDGLSNVIVNTPSGSVTGPTSTYYATMASGWGNNNGTLRVNVDNIPTTPSISAGYVSGANSSSRSVYVPTTIPYNPTVTVNDNTVTIPNGYYPSQQTKTVPGSTPTLQNKTVTPTTSQQTVNADSGYDGLDTVTVNAMPNGTLGTAIGSWSKDNSYIYTRFDFPNFVAGYLSSVNPLSISQRLQDETITPSTISQTVTPNSNGYYLNSVTVNAMPSGTAGTPTATKGTVSNHSVSVTPSVTNTAGYITGGTINGTAVSVSASELVSGNLAITENGTGIDVANYSTVSVDVSGGGSSGVQVAVGTPMTGANSSIIFENILGSPTSFALISGYDISIDTDPIVAALAYDGTNYVGQTVTDTSNANASYLGTGFSHQYNSSGHTITIISTNANFDTYSRYMLVYSYGGSSSDVHTSDVQVGSGATSITFPVVGNPMYWSCVFKSNFGTSSGYQRVIAVGNNGNITAGLCLDSSAHASNQYWNASYSGGNFTISSQGTNAGGYFHQPGYYQLTYVVDSSAPSYETVSKTYRASTSAQSEKIEPSTGYDAMSEVNISIPAVTQTNLVAGNIKSGTTISISNGSTNLWSVTGTYTGGGTSTCATTTMTNSNDQATSIEFTELSGQPKWFFVRCTSQLSRSSSYSYYYITAVRYNGTNHYGNYYRRSNGTFYNDTTHYSHTYSNGTLTVSSSASRGAAGGSFYNGTYELVYIY